jgi:hypothetical protein
VGDRHLKFHETPDNLRPPALITDPVKRVETRCQALGNSIQIGSGWYPITVRR